MAWNPFKRHQAAPEPQTSMLPPEVTDAIETAWMLTRNATAEDGAARVLVSIPGRRFFAENIDSNVAEKWPELNPAQHRRACQWLASKVAAHLRAGVQTMGQPGERWRDWQPLPANGDFQK